MTFDDLQPHQQRVVTERAELDERLNKLLTFTSTTTFLTLPKEDRDLLHEQAHYMQAYSNVLGQRVLRFVAAGVQPPKDPQ